MSWRTEQRQTAKTEEYHAHRTIFSATLSNHLKPKILRERKTNTSSENIVKRCQALYNNNNNDDDDDDEQEKKKRNTFVSFPLNDLTSVLTKVFIRLKSFLFTLPEPSNRNAISAWLGQSVKIIEIMFQVFPIPFYRSCY